MERHGERGRCCGGGGGAPYTDIPGQTRIPDIRIADARATGAAVGQQAARGPPFALQLQQPLHARFGLVGRGVEVASHQQPIDAQGGGIIVACAEHGHDHLAIGRGQDRGRRHHLARMLG